MNWLDGWRESFEVLWRRKLRTALTALSVAWGIFMLVVLLAAGEGLSNGAQAEFGGDALNSVWVREGRTSIPFQGNPIGKDVRLTNDDYGMVTGHLPLVEHAAACLDLGDESPIRRGARHAAFNLRACNPAYQKIENAEVIAGRYINDADVTERRKVAVIGEGVRDTLFGPGEPVLGEHILVGNVAYRVVGLFRDPQDEGEQQNIYLPLSTAQLIHGGAQRVSRIAFTVGDAGVAESETAIAQLRSMLAGRHGFAPQDRRAVRIWNTQEMWARVNALFGGIRFFVWVIGLGTILAGVVGVSNIMLISVQERTREIGVRKAVGARPAEIVGMVVKEALALTLISGYLGLLAAVAAVELANTALPPAPLFRRPEVDLTVGLGATLVLVVAGVLAGLFPALRAARVNPITALRVE